MSASSPATGQHERQHTLRLEMPLAVFTHAGIDPKELWHAIDWQVNGALADDLTFWGQLLRHALRQMLDAAERVTKPRHDSSNPDPNLKLYIGAIDGGRFDEIKVEIL